MRGATPCHRSAQPSGHLPACLRPAPLAWLQRSSWLRCPRYLQSHASGSLSSTGVATLQFHLENWPGLGMTISPANKAVYINPARHRAVEKVPVLTLRRQHHVVRTPVLQHPLLHPSASSGAAAHTPTRAACVQVALGPQHPAEEWWDWPWLWGNRVVSWA